jgi:hypothetical protein
MEFETMLKAIETRYKGCRFRSRLEARWAVFFDTMGWKWTYESEGYERNWNGQRHRWLPDFYLPEFKCLVEIKADWSNCTKDDLEKIVFLMDWPWVETNSPLPDFVCSFEHIGILLLDKIPFFDDDDFRYQTRCQTGLEYHKGIWTRNIALTDNGLLNLNVGVWREQIDISQGIDCCFDQFHKMPRLYQCQYKHPCYQVEEAGLKARYARFEHGEQG